MADDGHEVVGLPAEGEDGEGETPEPLVLGPILRYVDETSAVVWVETGRPGTVTILDHQTPTFTVSGKHYALVVIEDLAPASVIEYDVRLDGEVVWPRPDMDVPSSVIRTAGGTDVTSVLIGSCRAAAPHEPPYTLELAVDDRGRGVDTLWAHACRMLEQPPQDWPTLLVLVGDQIYADDSSPRTEERIEACRRGTDLPASIVLDYDEYAWLYHESWSPPLERWLFSVVPTVMIFDDHDVIDDWNISAAWVAEMEEHDWWEEHHVASYMSYFVYQHLGNLPPERLRREGILTRLIAAGDATETLRAWAEAVAHGDPDFYRFSYTREVGAVKVIVVDSRNGRVLEPPDARLMTTESEMSWVRREASGHAGPLLIATPLPVYIPCGLHDLQAWNERVCGGAWSRAGVRFGERLRRGLDLEHWSAFGRSFQQFTELLAELDGAPTGPSSIVVASGDIHFSYVGRVGIGASGGVHQLVSSPIRNALIPPERGAMRLSMTRVGARLAAGLRRLARAGDTHPGLEMVAGPFFANNMCEVFYRDDGIEVVIEQARSPDHDDEGGALAEVARVVL